MSLSAAWRAQGHTGTHTREWEDHTFAIKTNTFCSWSKYILQQGQIFFAIGTNTFYIWDKYIWQLGQVHFIIGTNTFSDWDKSGQTPIAISVPVTSRTQGRTPRSSKEGCSLRCFILRVSGNS